jgi:hypothetical protein
MELSLQTGFIYRLSPSARGVQPNKIIYEELTNNIYLEEAAYGVVYQEISRLNLEGINSYKFRLSLLISSVATYSI